MKKWLLTCVTLALVAAAGPAAAAGLLDEIKQRGKVVVGTEAAFEPFEFVKDGKIVGYNKEILDYIVADMGVELEQLNLPFQGILPGVLARKFDFVATSVAINEERAKKYAYTRPIGAFANAIVVREDNKDIKSPDDLNGRIVATQLASSVQPVLEAHDKSLKAAGGSGYKELKLYQAFPETHVALASGQVDAISIATPSAAVLMKKRPGVYKVVGTVGEASYLSWVTRPDDLDLRDYINSKIDELREAGQLKKWQRKWFGFTMKTPKEDYLPPNAF
ncbi:MAG: transporter substrate-binding domain-containing protein [Alphaproteobacteria bacterium]|nr:transporter substrate-binding domain-containing protein [Alphaproteobacteria bacterium]